jgi:sugar lactone lactonase YvrE
MSIIIRQKRNQAGPAACFWVAKVLVLIAPVAAGAARPKRFLGIVILLVSTVAFPAGLILAGPDTQYHIQTLAGNGRAGDIPDGGGKATEISVDLPFGLENGPDGALYITTVGSHRVLRLDRQGDQVTSVAGNGRKGYSGDGGPATKASLNEPYEVRFDSHGNMLILDMQNHAIRRVDKQTGTITTVAGDGVAGDRGDGGPARQARFRAPHSITLDDKDNLYVSDLANHRVRRIDAATGQIESIVGNGKGELPHDGGNARDEPFLTPQGLAIRGDHLWIASVSGHSLWRLHLKQGTIHREPEPVSEATQAMAAIR